MDGAFCLILRLFSLACFEGLRLADTEYVCQYTVAFKFDSLLGLCSISKFQMHVLINTNVAFTVSQRSQDRSTTSLRLLCSHTVVRDPFRINWAVTLLDRHIQ